MSQPIKAWSSATRTLTAEQARQVAETGLVTVEFDDPPNSWRLTADSRVGVVAGSDWEVRVAPRIEIPKLMFLLAYSVDRNGWRDSIAEFQRDPDFFAAIASGFAFHAYRAIEPGPLRGYVTVDERAYALRGRLRVADQISRSSGLPLPLEITFDDYALDVPENQILRGAGDLLLRFPRVPAAARKRLLRMRAILEDVTPATGPVALPDITRLNLRYEPALRLAALILERASIATEAGDVRSASFVFDMNQVFEDFLSTALTEALLPHGGVVRLQYRREFLDHERALRLKPDITWWRRGHLKAVVDAKYKQLKDERFPNADAYQMLAYCAGLAQERGFLVYARDPEQRSRTHRVRDGRTMIEVRAIDLQATPDEVLQQVSDLAAEVAKTRADDDASLSALAAA
jgi:5-methylcytosine-specific restriction enzyme subunit McrC